MDDGKHAVVLFDGVCNLCNGTVNFLIDRDKADRFRFGSLQSPAGSELLSQHSIQRSATDSVILIEDGEAYVYSTAALRIARRLGGIWSLAYAFIIIPSGLRDICYKLIAKYRYKMFGRSDVCRMPTPEDQRKFI